MSKKLVVLFPGIGYHNDKPLMYYTKKIANKAGHEIIEVSYDLSQDVASVKGDNEKRHLALDKAFQQVKDKLKDIKFEQYERVVFVGKSIGTTIMARYALENKLDMDMIIFTPIPETFEYLGNCEGLLFHGSADPLCDTDMCVQLCEEMSITYAIIPDANHSLETGEVETDIQNLTSIMTTIKGIIY